jgi:hypothetical protein
VTQPAASLLRSGGGESGEPSEVVVKEPSISPSVRVSENNRVLQRVSAASALLERKSVSNVSFELRVPAGFVRYAVSISTAKLGVVITTADSGCPERTTTIGPLVQRTACDRVGLVAAAGAEQGVLPEGTTSAEPASDLCPQATGAEEEQNALGAEESVVVSGGRPPQMENELKKMNKSKVDGISPKKHGRAREWNSFLALLTSFEELPIVTKIESETETMVAGEDVSKYAGRRRVPSLGDRLETVAGVSVLKVLLTTFLFFLNDDVFSLLH